jgi:hypothetical protein
MFPANQAEANENTHTLSNPYGFGDYETKVTKGAIIDVLTFLDA